MKHIYTLLLALLLPLVLIRLLLKSLKNPDYRRHINERLAYNLPQTPENTLHFHCVSVGEFLSLRPLLETLLKKHPQTPLLITCTTPTGRAQIKRFAKTQTNIHYSYLPYDLPHLNQRFLNHHKIKALILMETEIWPNLLNAAQKQHIPTLLINARLSRRSLRAYYRFARPLRQILKNLIINAQSRLDAQRFKKLCRASHIETTPSLKWALPTKTTPPLKDFLNKAPRWIAASTHPNEEEAIIHCHKTLQKTHPELQLCIAPRHPERTQKIKKQIEKQGFKPILRSKKEKQTSPQEIAILDTLGELNSAYQSAQLAFIGGSLVPKGGHNPIEALQTGIPIIFGKSMYNFQNITNTLLKEEFAQQSDEKNLAHHALKLLQQKQNPKKIKQYCQQKSANILNAHMNFLEQHLKL